MRLPSRLLGLYLLEDMSALPPSLWPNHGRSVRGVFAQVQGSRCREGMGFSMVIVVSREADACGPRDVQSRHEGYSSKPKPAVCGYQDRVTLSAVGAAAMASWVTRCWSPASVAGVARPEPDVPEAPLVRPGRRLPVARPHLVRDLAGQVLLFGEMGTRPEASPAHRQGRCRSPSPIPGPRRRFPCTR